MLFSRIYSWIKYKTLPPSVLFLNRLYVERDSKSRRVTSNLGLTFRNSKWSSYARTNINLKSKSDYLQLLYRLLAFAIAFIALTNFTSYYATNSLVSLHYTFLWFLFDADLYLKTVFSSALLCSAQLTISSLYTRFFASQLIETTNTSIAPNLGTSMHLPKRLHKPVLYAWLKSSPNSLNFSDTFDLSGSNQAGLSLYRNLFLTTRLIRSVSNSSTSTLTNLNQVITSPSQPLDALSGLSLPKKSTALALDYLLFSRNRVRAESYFTELNQWSLGSIHQELAKNSESLTFLNGLFYSPSIKNSKVSRLSINYPELSGLKYSLENQMATIKWQRWLYKYNLLHRSTLSGSQQINAAKKLLNSGFYTSTLTTNNIWASSVFTDTQEMNSKIQDLNDSLYASSPIWFNKNSLAASNGFLNSSTLETLKFYESSYNWFIKRFYSLNTLGTNKVVLRPKTKSQINLTKNITNFSTASASLNQDLTYFTPAVSSSLDVHSSEEVKAINFSNVTTSDVYLNYHENSFLTKGRLELIQNLVKSQSNSSILFYQTNTPKVLNKPNF